MAGIFDRVVVGLNKGINSVSEGSKKMVEKAQLNTQLSDEEKKKDWLLKSIGSVVYNLQQEGKIYIEQCAEVCNELSDLNQNISNLKEQLRLIEMQSAANNIPQPIMNGIRCSCGNVNKEGARFCAKCGQSL